MYKELAFSEDQQGFGLVFTDPSTGIRCLLGYLTHLKKPSDWVRKDPGRQ